MTPRARIRISSSIGLAVLAWLDADAGVALGGPRQPGDRQAELGDQPVGERGLVQPREPDRRAAAADLDPGARRQLDGAAPVAPQHAGGAGAAR